MIRRRCKINLATECRPLHLEEVRGNNRTIKTLTKMVATDKVPQTILLYGPSGCGKTTVARCIAAALNIPTFSTFEYNAGNTRGIETARTIEAECQQTPLYNQRRMYILDESHQLRKDTQQALLKVTEEPPKGTYFVYCTIDQNSMLPMLRNRCITFPLTPLNNDDMVELLSGIVKVFNLKVVEGGVKHVVTIAEGIPRVAINLLEKINDKQDMDEIVDLLTGDGRDKVVQDNIFHAALGSRNWQEVMSVYNQLDVKDSETLRHRALAYYTACLKKANGINEVQRFYVICDLFKTPTYDSGESGFLSSLAKVLHVK